MNLHLVHQQARSLAQSLAPLRLERPFVLAIPRGGVVLADVVARSLGAPLDVLIAGKVLAPGGVAIGGVAEGGALVFDDGALAGLDLRADVIERLVASERARQAAMLERIRGSWPMPELAGRAVVIVDDAVITGLTMRAAVTSVRARDAGRVIVATPLCAADHSGVLAAGVQEIVRLETLPASVAARVHGDERARPCPPLGDPEIHDLVARELREIGADPFGQLVLDGGDPP